MLALASHIETRLQALPALAGWDIRTGTEPADRRAVPAASLRCIGAQVQDSESSAVTLDPAWLLTLVVARSAQAAAELDAALQAAIGSLHNWYPGTLSGQPWRRMALQTVREPELAQEGLAGIELVFGTSAVFHGAQAGK